MAVLQVAILVLALVRAAAPASPEHPSLTVHQGQAITVTEIPVWGDRELLLGGRVHGVEPAAHRVAVYIRVGGAWWTKPTFAEPATVIEPDGTWTCDIITGGLDHEATHLVAFLIPADDSPPLMQGEGVARGAVSISSRQGPRGAQLPSAHRLFRSPVARKDRFCPPGSRPQSLHRRRRCSLGGWRGSPPHTGAARGRVAGDRGHLRQDLWLRDLSDCAARGCRGLRSPRGIRVLHMGRPGVPAELREVDIELSYWGVAGGPNAQFVVQPSTLPGHLHRFDARYGDRESVHAFTWRQAASTSRALHKERVSLLSSAGPSMEMAFRRPEPNKCG